MFTRAVCHPIILFANGPPCFFEAVRRSIRRKRPDHFRLQASPAVYWTPCVRASSHHRVGRRSPICLQVGGCAPRQPGFLAGQADFKRDTSHHYVGMRSPVRVSVKSSRWQHVIQSFYLQMGGGRPHAAFSKPRKLTPRETRPSSMAIAPRVRASSHHRVGRNLLSKVLKVRPGSVSSNHYVPAIPIA